MGILLIFFILRQMLVLDILIIVYKDRGGIFGDVLICLI